MASIDACWAQFRRRAGEPPARWVPELRTALRQIHPDLGVEVHPAENAGRELRILSLGHVSSLPLAREVAARAPRVVPWCYEVGSPRLRVDEAAAQVLADAKLDLTLARFRLGVVRGHLFEVVVASHLFAISEDDVGQRAAEQLVRSLLGDADFEDWVAAVSVVPGPRPTSLRLVGSGNELPIGVHELVEAFEGARAAVLAQLPDVPNHRVCERADWVMFELSEAEWAKGAGQAERWRPQADLLTTSTMCPEMLKCFLSDEPFSSARFSRHNELFCYLKLRLREQETQARLEQRAELEELLNRCLVPGQLGCVVGTGIGQEYIYLDLALSQTLPAIELMFKRLQAANVARDSWLLFCDSQFRCEWLGVWSDSPVPADVREPCG